MSLRAITSQHLFKNGSTAKVVVAFMAALWVVSTLTTFSPMTAQAAPDYVNVAKSAGDLKTVAAKMTINAPPQFVWRALTSYGDLPKFVSSYKQCHLVSSNGQTKTLDIRMSVSRLLPTYRYKMQVKENPKALKLNLKRVSGDFKRLDGSYRLVPASNGAKTVLIYNGNVDPGNSLPGSTGMIKSNISKTLSAVKSQSERQHRKSMIGKN